VGALGALKVLLAEAGIGAAETHVQWGLIGSSKAGPTVHLEHAEQHHWGVEADGFVGDALVRLRQGSEGT
jgi:hypothetical protein